MIQISTVAPVEAPVADVPFFIVKLNELVPGELAFQPLTWFPEELLPALKVSNGSI